MLYSVTIEKGEDSGYVAHCPAIPGCHSQGANYEDTLGNIKDAIRGCVEALGADLLVPSREAIQTTVEV